MSSSIGNSTIINYDNHPAAIPIKGYKPMSYMPDEMVKHVFSFNAYSDNLINRSVCKQWHKAATEIAKKQLISPKLSEITRIESKAVSFLKMVSQDLSFYCPVITTLKDMKTNHANYSLKHTFDNCVSFKIEKFTICMAKFFTINPNCPNIPVDKKEAFAGKTFVAFHAKDETTSDYLGNPYTITMFPVHNAIYFPIELFELTVSKSDNTILGDKKGTFVLPLHGKLTELDVIEGEAAVRDANFIGLGLNSTKTTVVNLTREDAAQGYIWPNDMYVPAIDALAPSKVEEVSDQD